MALQLRGGRTVKADRDTVWAALQDVACLRLCVPGCSAMERVSESRFNLSVLVPIGPVAVAFSGTLDIADCDPCCNLRLVGRGAGGLAGLATGSASIALSDVAVGCRLDYVVDFAPSGPFAAAGTLLLAGLAQAMVDRFAKTFAAIVGQSVAARTLRSTRPRLTS